MNREFAAFLDVERGELHPDQGNINLQMGFKRSDTTTATSIVDGTLLMLPYTEYKLISQPQATSVVGCDGNMSQFVGDCVATPPSLALEGMFEQSTTITLQVQASSGGGGGETHGGLLKKLFRSDINLKENIKYINNFNGIGIYTYNYVWDKEEQVGVMAQELLNTEHANAVSLDQDGYYQVDYGMLPEALLDKIDLIIKTTDKYKH